MPLDQVLLLVKAASGAHATLDFFAVNFPLAYPHAVDNVVAALALRGGENLVVGEAFELLEVGVVDQLCVLDHLGISEEACVSVNS